MHIKSYKSGAVLQYKKSPDGLQVQLPGYVSTSSWNGANGINDDVTVSQKGRVMTPPPSATMGLHQLTLEAFWLD